MVDAAPRAFIADRTILVVIANDNYSATRGGIKPYDDILNAKFDGKMAEMCLGADDDQHKIVRQNVSYNDLKELMKDLTTKLHVNKAQGLRTLVKVYFAGHGAMKNLTYCITATPGKQPYYPLENMLMKLSAIDEAFVFAIFDCCRDEL